jgi:hypothetical protein
MSHINQIDVRAVYDTERRELEITGTTAERTEEPTKLVGIYLGVMQAATEQSDATTAYAAVPKGCLGLEKWMARFEGSFGCGAATVSGVAIDFGDENAALETYAWAQTIAIEAGELDDLDLDRWPDDDAYAQTAA